MTIDEVTNFIVGWARQIINSATLVYDADFVTGNLIDGTVNTVSWTQVPFDTDHYTTISNLLIELNGMTGVRANLDSSDTNNRTILIETELSTATIVSTVTGGASQPIAVSSGESLIIIQSHQNAPAPELTYMTVGYAGNLIKLGRNTAREIDDNGNRLLINDYSLALEVREVNGIGSRLSELINSIERQGIQSLFNENCVSYLSNGSILQVPRLEYNDWIRESLVELQLAIAMSVTEASSWISTIEYTGEIGGLVNG